MNSSSDKTTNPTSKEAVSPKTLSQPQEENTTSKVLPFLSPQTLRQKNSMLLIDTATPLLFLGKAENHEGQWQLIDFVLSPKVGDGDDWLKIQLQDFYSIHFSKPPHVIGLGQGPGSFTSIRCGFAFVSVLASLWQIPCLNFSSYKLLQKLAQFFYPQAKLFIRANRYLYFSYQQSSKKVVALSAHEWQTENTTAAFFDYEDKEILSQEFGDSFCLLASTLNEKEVSVPLNFLTDVFVYPQKQEEAFPFEPDYGIDITFKQKETT